MDLLNSAQQLTNEYIDKMPKAMRKKYGQFFTSAETAQFMANLFEIPSDKEELSFLDAGAGSGMLSIALIERIEKLDCVKRLHLVCYENDENILDLLKQNLDNAKNRVSFAFDYELRSINYITSQEKNYRSLLGSNGNPEQYDLVIGNPPYMKIPKDAPEALAMPDVCYGAPNLYFLFASMGLYNLKKDGQLVYIVPRSWTSGAYFKAFRQKFLGEASLEHIHLFVSRDKVFDKETVLQETMIFKVRKTSIRPKDVFITTTKDNSDFKDKTSFAVPYNVVVSGGDSYVFLPTCQQEVEVIEKLNKWTDTLPSIGLKMKTGLTVDFRNRDVLRNEKSQQTVPLFYSQHIKNGKVIFPIGKENEYIETDQKGLLQANTNYLFVKRFTAKEEPRRLQCGVYLARKNPDYESISTQNKINFINGLEKLSECIVYGLYVLFNSTLYDGFYRILNGSTQVNSTEVNAMPVPPISIIEAMGKKLIRLHNMSVQSCDAILEEYV